MKRHIKTLSSLIILLFVFVFITGCFGKNDPAIETPKEIELSILSINDFHGQLEENDGEAGAARIATFINKTRNENPEGTILLAAGDMFQGTGISNIGYGIDVVNFMNMMKFDAMTIGNHEFDWGLSTILAYRDGNLDNGEANFPFLSSNIYQKSTEGLPQYLDEYTMIERLGLKIAIIGYIGYDQTNDISASQLVDYEFLQPLELVRENIKKARTVDNADVVIVSCHDDSSAINKALASGTGEYEVDAIVNAHTHSKVNKKILRSEDKRSVPTVQSGSSGECVGLTTLKYDTEIDDVVEASVINVNMSSKIAKDQQVLDYVNSITEKYSDVFDRKLCVAGENISRSAGTAWAAKALYNYSIRELGECDITLINSGGIRASAFPVSKGQIVDVKRVYQMMPFDNKIIMVSLPGKILKNLLIISDVVYAGTITIVDGVAYINGEIIKDDVYYNVAVIDFLFDKYESTFMQGTNIRKTELLFRDVLINEFEVIGQNNEQWLG